MVDILKQEEDEDPEELENFHYDNVVGGPSESLERIVVPESPFTIQTIQLGKDRRRSSS